MSRARSVAFVAGVIAVACGVARPHAELRLERHLIELSIWPPDSSIDIRATPLALAQLDTIAGETRSSRIEQAWCTRGFRIQRSYGGRTLVTVSELERAHYTGTADSIHISADRPLCDDGIPGLHSHVIWAGGWLYFPSPTDLATAARGSAPFNLLLSAGDGRVTRLTIYALRRESEDPQPHDEDAGAGNGDRRQHDAPNRSEPR